jgi:hypothetical protein
MAVVKKMKPLKVGTNDEFHDHYCEKALDAGLRGLTREQFAAELKVSPRTIDNWKKKYPEFAEAFEIADNMAYCWMMDEVKGYITNPAVNAAVLKIYMTKYHGYKENTQTDVNLEHSMGIAALAKNRPQILAESERDAD